MMSIFFLIVSLSVVYTHNITSIHKNCFDVFIPLINRMANEAKDTSGTCIITANTQKDNEMGAINRTRSDLASEIKRIKETLLTCSAENDNMGYFDCLRRIVEIDRKIVTDITARSSKYSNKMNEIEAQQTKCFRNSVSKVKDKSSNAIYSLEYCLTSVEPRKSDETVSTFRPFLYRNMETTPNMNNYN